MGTVQKFEIETFQFGKDEIDKAIRKGEFQSKHSEFRDWVFMKSPDAAVRKEVLAYLDSRVSELNEV